MTDITLKDLAVAILQVGLVAACIFGVIGVIVYASNTGKEQLQYVTVTPYARHVSIVATFKEGECQPFFENLKDKENYRCISSLTAVKEEILGANK